MDRLTVLLVVIFVSSLKSGIAQDFNTSEFKDLLQIGGDVKVTEIPNTRSARNLDQSFEDGVENFIKTNELTMEVPFGSSVTFSGRNIDSGEFNFKLRLDSGSEVQARKKSKIKKVLAPILIVLLLKAITLIPLALGLLGLKTWNALQLSFVSFVTSIVLAVWKLCSKFSDHHPVVPHVVHEAVHDVHVPHYHDPHHDHHDHHVVHHDHHDHHDLHYDDHHHDPWGHHYHRSDDSPQQMAYNGYAPETKI